MGQYLLRQSAVLTDRVGSYAWKAWRAWRPGVWELGRTEAEAIGKLVITLAAEREEGDDG